MGAFLLSSFSHSVSKYLVVQTTNSGIYMMRGALQARDVNENKL